MNAFTSTLSLKYPIIQGPFGGGLSSIELVKAVADFGGLGSFGAHHLSPEKITSLIQKIRSVTQGAFAINLWVSNSDNFIDRISRSRYSECVDIFDPTFKKLGVTTPTYSETISENFENQLQATLAASPPAISFVYGVPSHMAIDECKRRNIVTIGTATTVPEAMALEEAGIDVIVATGFEAGGHRVSFLQEPEECLTGSLSLIPLIADKVTVPVIAAGGIADVRGLRASMALGAKGVQIGTAFLACKESGTTDMHRRALFSKQSQHTVLSRAYTGRLARFIENDFIRLIRKSPELPLPFPIQSHFTGFIKNAANEQENAEYASLYAGQSSPLLKHSTALELLNALVVDFV